MDILFNKITIRHSIQDDMAHGQSRSTTLINASDEDTVVRPGMTGSLP